MAQTVNKASTHKNHPNHFQTVYATYITHMNNGQCVLSAHDVPGNVLNSLNIPDHLVLTVTQ